MKLRKTVFILALWTLGAGAELFACGNKFLVPGRGTRFGRVAVAREGAAVLIYANSKSTMPLAIGDVPVEMILLQAGYTPTMVRSADELEQALVRQSWDLVLADLGDSELLRTRFTGDVAPAILPVVHQPTRAVYAAVKKDYGRALKSPFKGQRLLDTVDDAVAMRAE